MAGALQLRFLWVYSLQKHGDPFQRTTTCGVWSKSVARYMTHKEKLWSGPQPLFATFVHLSKSTFWPATMWTCCEVQVYLGAVALNLVRSLWWYNHVSLSSKTCSPKPQLITVNLSLTWHGLQLRIFLFAASKAWPRGLRPPCARSLCTPVTSENFRCCDSFAEENQKTHRRKNICSTSCHWDSHLYLLSSLFVSLGITVKYLHTTGANANNNRLFQQRFFLERFGDDSSW